MKVRKLGISVKIFMAVLVLLAVSDLVMGIVLYHSAKSALMTQINENAMNVVRCVAASVDGRKLDSIRDGVVYGEAYEDVLDTLTLFLENSGVEYVYDAGVSELVGNTYTCSDTETGICSFEVNEDGSAALHTEEMEYTGYMSRYNDEWNLMVSNEEAEESIDWIVYIDGTDFTYVPYAEYLYGDYAGEMQAFGQYGDVTFTLNADGTISADVKVDGKKKHFEGNYYVNSEDGVVSSAYLTCEDDQTILDIAFDEVDGMMNYHGHYMIPLAAG